jgi:hypothetical protein
VQGPKKSSDETIRNLKMITRKLLKAACLLSAVLSYSKSYAVVVVCHGGLYHAPAPSGWMSTAWADIYTDALETPLYGEFYAKSIVYVADIPTDSAESRREKFPGETINTHHYAWSEATNIWVKLETEAVFGNASISSQSNDECGWIFNDF